VKWATRAGVHIDRAACAWLIRRFLDRDAEFVFVTELRGLSMRGDDDHTLAVSGAMFDGLYEFHRRRLLLGREPA
jgi:hypothetical protein